VVRTGESVVCVGFRIHALAHSGSYTDLGELLGRSVPALEGVSLHSPGARNARTFAMAPVISCILSPRFASVCPGLFGLGGIWVVTAEGRCGGICQQGAAAAIAKPW